MAEKKQILFGLKNRSAGIVVYTVPDLGIRREFQPGETKKVTKEEIEKLSYTAGGQALIDNFLIVEEPVREDLGMEVEPEYDYTEQDIVELIKNGDLDHWEDMLNFAPMGVIDLVKAFCVSLPLTDLNKAQMLLDKTGFDAMAAIKAEKEVAADLASTGATEQKKPRRKTEGKKAIKAEATSAPVRKTSK